MIKNINDLTSRIELFGDSYYLASTLKAMSKDAATSDSNMSYSLNESAEQINGLFDLIKDIEAYLSCAKKQPSINEKHIGALQLTARSHNCLMAANIDTVGKLIEARKKGVSVLFRIPGFGKKSMREIDMVLEGLGAVD